MCLDVAGASQAQAHPVKTTGVSLAASPMIAHILLPNLFEPGSHASVFHREFRIIAEDARYCIPHPI